MNTIPWGLGKAPGGGSVSVTQVVSSVTAAVSAEPIAVAVSENAIAVQLVSPPQLTFQEE